MKKVSLVTFTILTSLLFFTSQSCAEENNKLITESTQESGLVISTEVEESRENSEGNVLKSEIEEETRAKEESPTEESSKSVEKADVQLFASPKRSTPEQGGYIKDGRYVKMIGKNYDIWQNFDWVKKNNTKNLKDNLYQARGRYEHKNGQTYFSIFDNKGKWMGYLNANAVKTTNNAQGDYIKDGSYVSVNKISYDIWQNFNWKFKSYSHSSYLDTVQARGRYEHFNGSTYYSVFNNKGKWLGYLNAKATNKVGKQGAYQADGRYVKITKKNYTIWSDFNWKNKSNSTNYYGEILKAKGHYNNSNGSRYYSLFEKNGKWVGYLNVNAATVQDAPYGGRPIMLDELDFSTIFSSGYSYARREPYNSQRFLQNDTGLIFKSDKEASDWFRKEGFKTGDGVPIKIKGSNHEYGGLIANGSNHWSLYIDETPKK